ENYICYHFEEWDLDNPIEEEYLDDYKNINGASLDELLLFEKNFNIILPDDFKTLYQYKNGSQFFCLFPLSINNIDMTFCLMSLQEIKNSKTYFQNRNALLTDFPDYFTNEDINKMKNNKIKPFLFNKKWFPFAQYCNSCYLMLDLDPNKEGQIGQIILYCHDPDQIIYVTSSISELITKILKQSNNKKA
ncbi:SMI1/KNR4 family protein, partial [Eggerthia catenaformis]